MTHGIIPVDLAAERAASRERSARELLDARARLLLGKAGWGASEAEFAEAMTSEFPGADAERRAITIRRAIEIREAAPPVRLSPAEVRVRVPEEVQDLLLDPKRRFSPLPADLEPTEHDPPAADPLVFTDEEEDEMPRPRRDRALWLAAEMTMHPLATNLRDRMNGRFDMVLSPRSFDGYLRFARDLIASEPEAVDAEVAARTAGQIAPQDSAASDAGATAGPALTVRHEAEVPAMATQAIAPSATTRSADPPPAEEGGFYRIAPAAAAEADQKIAALSEEVRSLRATYEAGECLSVIDDGDGAFRLVVVVPDLPASTAWRAAAAVATALAGDTA